VALPDNWISERASIGTRHEE